MRKKPFELLQVAVGTRKELSGSLSVDEWNGLFKVLKKQALFGVGFDAICQLPAEQRPPKPLLLQGYAQAEFIKEQNNLLNKRVLELRDIMQDMEIPYCILKGQGTAILYPKPESRQCGDIDVWCDCPRDLLLEKVGKKYALGDKVIHHADVTFFKDISVDLHYVPTWLYTPWYSKNLQTFIVNEKSTQMQNLNEKGFCSPTVKFNLVYSMMHMFRHLFEEGIGLRQFMDYYYIIMHSNEWERKEAVGVIRKIGKTRFLGAVMYVLQKVFLLDEKYLLVKPNKELGEFLMNEIWIGGNFGYHDNRVKKDKSLSDRVKRRLKRQLTLYSFGPSEVICGPFWKAWHYCWRKKNGYL
ncbi:MAG: nucleotidyltransferase family protein [Bacteroidaceae bacterium]|nr:nucleotidyltransferase family protein [Bacteroidaceae bacterium]